MTITVRKTCASFWMVCFLSTLRVIPLHGQQTKSSTEAKLTDPAMTISRALQFVKADKRGDKAFAWGAVNIGLQTARAESKTIQNASLDQVESGAVTEASKSSATALTSLYLLDTSRRRSVLGAPMPAVPTADQSLKFMAAGLAEYQDAHPSPLSDLSAFDGKPVTAQAATLYMIKLGTPVMQHPASKYLLHVPDCNCSTDLLPALFLARSKPVRDTISDPTWNLRLLQFLSACSLEQVDKTAPGMLMKRAAASAAYELVGELQDDTFDAILKQIAVQKTTQANPVADRAAQITVRLSKITGPYQTLVNYPFPGHWVTNQCLASSDPLVGVQEAFPGVMYAPNFWKDNYSCFKGTGFYCGSCFGSDTRTTMASDTGNSSTSLLGVEHRTYYPKGGSGRVNFNVRVGYHPASSTNFIAIRWRGFSQNAGPITCTSGCYTDKAITSEPATGWQVFMVAPEANLEFYEEVQSNVSEVANWPWYQTASLFQDDLELIEIDSKVASGMGTLDLTSLDQIAASNGLIRYVASTEKALSSGGWLAPSGDVADSTALGISRTALLAKIAALPDAAFPVAAADFSAANYPNVALKERRAFLKLAVVAIAYRTFERQSIPLQLQTALAAGVLPTVRTARKNLDDALEALAGLATDRKAELLQRSAKILGYDSDHDTTVNGASNDQLITSVIGAADAIAQLDNDMSLEQARRCMLLSAMEQKSNASLPTWQMRPEVSLACQQ